MIYKVSIAFLIPCLLIAFGLSFAGIQSIGGNSYYNFLQDLSIKYGQFQIQIPSIPLIPKFEGVSIGNASNVLDFLKLIANFFVTLANVSISMLNIGILVINVVIDVVEFFIRLIRAAKDFISQQHSLFYMARTIV